jgi:hypothetical protein
VGGRGEQRTGCPSGEQQNKEQRNKGTGEQNRGTEEQQNKEQRNKGTGEQNRGMEEQQN